VQINNPNKVNQDSLLIKTNLAEKNTNLYAVADGHGTFGHLVSQFIVKNISKVYEQELKAAQLAECIPKVFEKIQKNLTDSDINASCSGSTLVNVLIDGDEVVCANVGDSRAILARQSITHFTQLIGRVGS
jgi:serine/threonine protein phosphatase PrpC